MEACKVKLVGYPVAESAHRGGGDAARVIFWEIRLPRALLGALVGGASLKADDFLGIVRAA